MQTAVEQTPASRIPTTVAPPRNVALDAYRGFVMLLLVSEGFPSGSVHLRPLRLKGRSALDLLAAPADFKTPVIEGLMRSYPDRRFVMVGDTGEQDPSIYAVLALRFPHQVARILLRQVEGAPPLPASLTTLPPGRWAVFDEPMQLRELVLEP